MIATRRHGNVRRFARDGYRHGACAFRPHRDRGETLEKVCAMQVPWFVRPPDAVQQRVYRLGFVNGWDYAASLVASEQQTP